MMDAVLQGLRKGMESTHQKMQISQNQLNKAEKYLNKLEVNALPQIARLEREYKADYSRMVNFYKTMVELQSAGKKSSANSFSKEGAKFKKITIAQQHSIKVLSSKIKSAKKCVQRAKKDLQKTTKLYVEASSRYARRRDYICYLEEFNSSLPTITKPQ